MRGLLLATVLWWSLLASDGGVEEEVRACVAPKPQKEETGGKDSTRKSSAYLFGTEHKEKGETGGWSTTTTPRLQFSRVAAPNTTLPQDDLVLPSLSGEQRTSEHLLQTMRKSLVGGVARVEEKIKVQEPKTKGAEIVYGSSSGSAVDGHLSRESPLGFEYAVNSHSSKSWGSHACSEQGRGNSGTNYPAASHELGIGCNSHCRRAQSTTESEEFAIFEHAIDGGDVPAIGSSPSQGSGSFLKQGVDAWSSEQIAQAQKPSEYIGYQDCGSRPGMDKIRHCHHDQGEGTCNPLPEVSSRPVRNPQSKDCRAHGGEERNECGIRISFGRCSDIDGDSRSPEHRRESAILSGCDDRRWYGWGHRSYSTAGGRRRDGGDGARRRQVKACREGTQAFPWISVTHQSRHTPPQSEAGGQGRKEGREVSASWTHMDRDVEQHSTLSNCSAQVLCDQLYGFVQSSRHFVDELSSHAFSWSSGPDAHVFQSASQVPSELVSIGALQNVDSGIDFESASCSLRKSCVDASEFLMESTMNWVDYELSERISATSDPLSNEPVASSELLHNPVTVLASDPFHCADLFSSSKGTTTKGKHVSFCEEVKVILAAPDAACSFSMNAQDVHQWLRHFWHLDGQIATWKVMQCVLANWQFTRSIWDLRAEGVACSESISSQSAIAVSVEYFPFCTQESNALWWSDLQTTVAAESQRTPWFVDTWFLAVDRFHICIRPRRVRIESAMHFADFESSCRVRWQDLMDHSPFQIYLVDGSPSGLPSTLAHVILIQGLHVDRSAVLLSSSAFPPLQTQRAVLFHREATVTEVFRESQFPFACGQQPYLCCLSFSLGEDTQRLTNDDHADIPIAKFVTGHLCPLQNEASDSESNIDTASTHDPLSDDDLETMSLCSLSHVLCSNRVFSICGSSSGAHGEQIRPTSFHDGEEGNSDLLWSWVVPGAFANSDRGEDNSDLTWSNTCIGYNHPIAEDAFDYIRTLTRHQEFIFDFLRLGHRTWASAGTERNFGQSCQSASASEICPVTQSSVGQQDYDLTVPLSPENWPSVRSQQTLELHVPTSGLSWSPELTPSWCALSPSEQFEPQVIPDGAYSWVRDGVANRIEEEDVVSWMNIPTCTFQLDDPDPYPWLQDGLDPDEEVPEEDPPDVEFAAGHEGKVREFVDLALEDLPDSPEPWTAITFGLGLVDLGRRDTPFNPWMPEELPQKVFDLWHDHAQYGGLTIYFVQPQLPGEIGGIRTLVLLVVVESPDDMNPDIRNVLVTERGPADVYVRPQPYGAKIFTGISAREVLVQLDAHRRCKPFVMRDCTVRLGHIVMEPSQFYDVEHGYQCNVRFGELPELVVDAKPLVRNVETFYLQIDDLQSELGSIPPAQCRFHGISPANQPLGYRTLFLSDSDLAQLDWISQARQLWPFSSEHSHIGFIAMATYDLRAREEVIFHFVIDYGSSADIPILVQQQIISARELQTGREGHTEHWAIRVSEGQISDAVLDQLYRSLFWTRRARDNRMRPSLIVNGARLTDVDAQWQSGDFLSITLRVWEAHHMLMFLLDSGDGPAEATTPEFTSFIQIHAVAQKIHPSLHPALDTPFQEICRTLCHSGPHESNKLLQLPGFQPQSQVNSSPYEPFHGSVVKFVGSQVSLEHEQQYVQMPMSLDPRPASFAFESYPELDSLRTAACCFQMTGKA